MSNLLTNPIIVSSTMAGTYKALLPTVNKGPYLKVEKIYWETPASVNDTFVINDDHSNLLLQGNCEVAGQSQIFDWTANPKPWRDFIVPTLASGTLYIYLR